MPRPGGSWQGKVISSVLLLVLVAVGGRLVADLLLPIVPTLFGISLIIALYVLVLRR